MDAGTIELLVVGVPGLGGLALNIIGRVDRSEAAKRKAEETAKTTARNVAREETDLALRAQGETIKSLRIEVRELRGEVDACEADRRREKMAYEADRREMTSRISELEKKVG